jgi:hypothetical protein
VYSVDPSSGAKRYINPAGIASAVLTTREALAKQLAKTLPNKVSDANVSIMRSHLETHTYVGGRGASAQIVHSRPSPAQRSQGGVCVSSPSASPVHARAVTDPSLRDRSVVAPMRRCMQFKLACRNPMQLFSHLRTLLMLPVSSCLYADLSVSLWMCVQLCVWDQHGGQAQLQAQTPEQGQPPAAARHVASSEAAAGRCFSCSCLIFALCCSSRPALSKSNTCTPAVVLSPVPVECAFFKPARKAWQQQQQ